MSRKKRIPIITEEEMVKQLHIEIGLWLSIMFTHKLRADTILHDIGMLRNDMAKGDMALPSIMDLLNQLTLKSTRMIDECPKTNAIAKESIKQMYRIVQSGGGNSIRNLKLFCKVFLEEYRRIIVFRVPHVRNDWLTDDEIEKMGNIAIAAYLET